VGGTSGRERDTGFLPLFLILPGVFFFGKLFINLGMGLPRVKTRIDAVFRELPSIDPLI
jgi:hypothetical protein